jgi:AraC-like DNA-binding protein
MDILSDVLRAVRLTGAIFFDHYLPLPFVGEAPPSAAIAHKVMPEAQHLMQFHALLSGSSWTALADEPGSCTCLGAGDIVMFPRGDGNVMSSEPGMRAKPNLAMYVRPSDRRLPFVLHHGVGQEQCRMICGYFGCDMRPFNPLLESLPRIFHVQMSPTGQSWLADMLSVAAEETELGGAGSETMLAKLAELIFVEVVRKYMARLPVDSPGWLSALKDGHIGHALRLIHGQPAHMWTLDALAHEVGLSRSVFADRFTRGVGVSPMHYLGRWRMQLAARRLEIPGVSVAQAGVEVGYESEAAFNRAFKKYVGTPPGAWRRSRIS